MYPNLTAAGNMRHVYNQKNSPQATLNYVTKQENLLAESIQKTMKVGIPILIRGTDPTQVMAKEEVTHPEQIHELSPDPIFDSDPVSLLHDHDEIDDFFNTVSDRTEEDQSYDDSSP